MYFQNQVDEEGLPVLPDSNSPVGAEDRIHYPLMLRRLLRDESIQKKIRKVCISVLYFELFHCLIKQLLMRLIQGEEGKRIFHEEREREREREIDMREIVGKCLLCTGASLISAIN
jgi:hypothetical protein